MIDIVQNNVRYFFFKLTKAVITYMCFSYLCTLHSHYHVYKQPEDEVHSILVEGPRINFNQGRTSHDTSELLHLVTTVLFLKTENPITVVSRCVHYVLILHTPKRSDCQLCM